jgi:EAL domain-containing protein (putative c-di-GMP-specific phosphodiesterase class I)
VLSHRCRRWPKKLQDIDCTFEVRLKLAKTLGLSVTTEGIETARQCRLFERLGCDLGQGYYFARSLPASEVVALLDASHQRNAPRAAA